MTFLRTPPVGPGPNPATRCGYVALLGVPNSGKSTLFNALVGSRLSIVTPKAQTTQRQILGLNTSDGTQLVLVDAPGVLHPRDLLQRALLAGAREAARSADLLALVLDPTHPMDDAARRLLLDVASEGRGPRIGIVNKTDLADAASVARDVAWLEGEAGARRFLVSARTGVGTGELLTALRALLPPGPFLFPEDDIAAEPVRFFAAECVREALFEQFEEEVPYATFCEIEEFREGRDRTYIQANLFVERQSQKGILIGEGGRAIRDLGVAAREKIEHFLGSPVYLDLWVKVLPGWRRKRAQLRRIGLPVPEDDGTPQAS
jgi:GTP-binding protein Era